MKIDIPDEFLEETLAIVKTEATEVVGYINIYEKGDCWIKIKSCEGCENIELCCRSCPMLSSQGCFFHLDRTLNKPHKCVVHPLPSDCKRFCQLEYKELKSGKIRKISNPGNIFD